METNNQDNVAIKFEDGDKLLHAMGHVPNVQTYDAPENNMFDGATLGRLRDELKLTNASVDEVVLKYYLSNSREHASIPKVQAATWRDVSAFYTLTSPAKSDKSTAARQNRTAYNTVYAKVKRLADSCGATYYGETKVYGRLDVAACVVPFNGSIDWNEAAAKFAGIKATRKFLVDARIAAIDAAKERGETLPVFPC